MKYNFSTSLNKANAFTLAEVLIVLGIIGVVAAMTIPNLITNYKAIRLKTQFTKAYSTIQQGFKLMEEDGVSLDPASYPSTAKTLFYKTYKNYLKYAVDCGDYYNGNVKKLPCYDYSGKDKFKSLDGKSSVDSTMLDGGQIVLNDGTLLFFNNDAYGMMIFVDINGYASPPNRLGYDLFVFEFKDEKLTTMGDFGTKYNDVERYCNFKGSGSMNGMACAQKAKADGDYFKTLVRFVK